MVVLVKDKEQKAIALLECPCQRPWDWATQIIVGQIPEKKCKLTETSDHHTANTGHISQSSKTSNEHSQENKV